jgi:predicted PurR-regulated permease PerM
VRPDISAKSSGMVVLASIAVVVGALYLAKGVLIPLTLAVLLSFLLSPVCDWLERFRLGRIPAVLATAVVAFTLLGGLAWLATVQMTSLAPKIPEYQATLKAKLTSVNAYAVSALSKVTSTAQEMDEELSSLEQAADQKGTHARPYSVRVVASPPSPLEVFGGMFGTFIEVLGVFIIVIVLVVYFLVRREDLRDRFIHIVGQGNVTLTTHVLEDAARRVSRYLLVLFFINGVYGISFGIGLYLIGLPNAILWGILASVLRFVPYIGPWIAAAMPIGLSLAISPDWVLPILTVGLFVVLELFCNNVLEPWLYGKNTGVSAVAVLVAAVFWMWLWGPVGLLLATPLTVCLLVIGKHVPQLSFLGILLGNEQVFEPKMRIYQRLLAGDQEEAAELLENYLNERPVVEVYDSVLIPALALTEMHWHRDELDERHHNFILQGLKEMIQVESDRRQERQADEETGGTFEANGNGRLVAVADLPTLCVLCVPARSEADEIASLLLAQVLETRGCQAQAVPATPSSKEMVDLIERRQVDVVYISATPPAAVMHARYLCKHLRTRFSKLTLVVGLWDTQVDLDKAKIRIGCSAAVVTTLADAQTHLRLQIPPFIETLKEKVS